MFPSDLEAWLGRRQEREAEKGGGRKAGNSSQPLACRRPKFGTESFTIVHFAGPVVYAGQGFVERNRDEPPLAVANVRQSPSPLLGTTATLRK